EPALAEGGIRLGVAGAAEGDEAVEVEIGAPLGTLAHVVDFKPAAQTARLADPAGPGQDLGANVLILLQAPRGASPRWRSAGTNAPPRGAADADSVLQPTRTPHPDSP